MDRNDLNCRLPAVVEAIVGHVKTEPRMQHLDRVILPSRDVIIESIKLLRQVLFPGYFGKQGLTSENLPSRMGELVIELTDMLFEQVRLCLRYEEKLPGQIDSDSVCQACDTRAAQIVSTVLHRVPDIREMLAEDVQAAFEGDPAAQNTDETIFCYPGLFAIFVQRVAHEFH